MVTSGGIELFVREQGAGHPLLMINGIGANLEMWGPAEERLSAVARTIAFDAPGTGRSGTPSWPLSMSSIAKLIWNALDELGYDRVDVLGFSLGGVLAQQLAREAQRRVRRLALVATGCGWGSMPGTLPALALIGMPLLRYHSRAFYEHTNRLISPDDAMPGRLNGASVARLRYPPSMLGYTYQFWSGACWSSLAWLPSLRIPTLVLAGASDNLVPPANAVQLTRLLPQSRLHILPDEGHFLVFDPDSKVHPLLEDFFASQTLRSSQAWATGTAVVDDETVQAAFQASVGGQPLQAMSEAFRRFVEWTAWATNGNSANGNSA
jgi:pimeloyl-ACP methyl ester carboxylesterase